MLIYTCIIICCHVGPAAQTVAQHYNYIGSTFVFPDVEVNQCWFNPSSHCHVICGIRVDTDWTRQDGLAFPTVYDAGPTLSQHRYDVLCLLGWA